MLVTVVLESVGAPHALCSSYGCVTLNPMNSAKPQQRRFESPFPSLFCFWGWAHIAVKSGRLPGKLAGRGFWMQQGLAVQKLQLGQRGRPEEEAEEAVAAVPFPDPTIPAPIPGTGFSAEWGFVSPKHLPRG